MSHLSGNVLDPARELPFFQRNHQLLLLNKRCASV